MAARTSGSSSAMITRRCNLGLGRAADGAVVPIADVRTGAAATGPFAGRADGFALGFLDEVLTVDFFAAFFVFVGIGEIFRPYILRAGADGSNGFIVRSYLFL